MSLEQLQKIRRFELKSIAAEIQRNVPKGGRILDIGAGTGWQAKSFADAGYSVTAIDMPTSVYARDRVHPITDYDGHHIPAPDEYFDAVYSSNVLEHVPHGDAFQREIRRVLKPGGVAVHVVPSGSWRFYSNAVYYPYLVKRLYARLGGAGKGRGDEASSGPGDARAGGGLLRVLVPRRDGEVGNALTEIYHFSRWRWLKLFRNNGWMIEKRDSNHLVYTACYLLGTALPISARERLSRLLGGSCHVFVLRPSKTVQQ